MNILTSSTFLLQSNSSNLSQSDNEERSDDEAMEEIIEENKRLEEKAREAEKDLQAAKIRLYSLSEKKALKTLEKEMKSGSDYTLEVIANVAMTWLESSFSSLKKSFFVLVVGIPEEFVVKFAAQKGLSFFNESVPLKEAKGRKKISFMIKGTIAQFRTEGVVSGEFLDEGKYFNH